ncbi:hypothetical protein Tco_1087820 [Tanacetum coccineum]
MDETSSFTCFPYHNVRAFFRRDGYYIQASRKTKGQPSKSDGVWLMNDEEDKLHTEGHEAILTQVEVSRISENPPVEPSLSSQDTTYIEVEDMESVSLIGEDDVVLLCIYMINNYFRVKKTAIVLEIAYLTLSIGVSNLRQCLAIQWLKHAILAMDDKISNVDQLESILKWIPTREEMAKLKVNEVITYLMHLL